jgi:hypothetical protein
MSVQRAEILGQLKINGWEVMPLKEHELEWWADEIWLLSSKWSPVGGRAYLTFLVDPQIADADLRQKGEAVWAVMASTEKPTKWQSAADDFTLSLNRGWKERLPELLERLSALRGKQGV